MCTAGCWDDCNVGIYNPAMSSTSTTPSAVTAFGPRPPAMLPMLSRVGVLAPDVVKLVLCCVLQQVTLLPELPVASGNPHHLLSWKEMSRRVLLERSGRNCVNICLQCVNIGLQSVSRNCVDIGCCCCSTRPGDGSFLLLSCACVLSA
jgi:hypothetical protein